MQYDLGVRTVKIVLETATKRLHRRRHRYEVQSDSFDADLSDPVLHEEAAIVAAFSTVLAPKMEDAEDESVLRNVIRDVFPMSSRPKSGTQKYDPDLVSAIQEQLVRDRLQATPEHVSKVRSGQGHCLCQGQFFNSRSRYVNMKVARDLLQATPEHVGKVRSRSLLRSRSIL